MDGLVRALIKAVRRRLRADEEVTVEAVTKELGYTRQYISGRFHRITGRLLSQFLKEKRLEKAARLLKAGNVRRSEEHTSELQSPCNLVCRLLLEKKKKKTRTKTHQGNNPQPSDNRVAAKRGVERE